MKCQWKYWGLFWSLCFLSTVAAANYVTQKNIPYYNDATQVKSGDSGYALERCKLDIYYPENGKNTPVVIWFHGGGLITGGKSFPAALQQSGIAVVAVNYRLSSARAKAPDYLLDAAQAVRWVFDHAAEYGINRESIYLCGGSGGAWLIAMLALDEQYLAQVGLTPQMLAAVAPISGQMSTHLQIQNERKNKIGLDPVMPPEIDSFAPLFYIKSDTPKLWFYVGDRNLDWPGRAEENALLVRLLQSVAKNSKAKLTELSGFGHDNVYTPAQILLLNEITRNEAEKIIRRQPPVPVLQVTNHPGVEQELSGRNGEKIQEPTRFSLRQDGENFYFAIEAQFDPATPLYNEATADDHRMLCNGDSIEIFFAPNEAQKEKCLQFAFSPNGFIYDADYGVFALDAAEKWQSGITFSSKINGKYWRIEAKIPFSTLNYTPGTPAAMNVFRHHYNAKYDSNWSQTGIEKNFLPQRFGQLIVNEIKMEKK